MRRQDPVGSTFKELAPAIFRRHEQLIREIGEMASNQRRLEEAVSLLGNTVHDATARARQSEEQMQSLQFNVLGISPALEALSDRHQQLQTTAHEYFTALTLDLPSQDLALTRFLPVRMYLHDDEPHDSESVYGALDRLLDELGFEISDHFPGERGSWFQGFIGRSREKLKSQEVQSRVAKVERAAELEFIDGKQARADRDHLEGVATLITALSGQDYAVVQIGSVLLVKWTDDTGRSQIITRTLTHSEMLELEKHPELLKEPARVLERLSGHRPVYLPDQRSS